MKETDIDLQRNLYYSLLKLLQYKILIASQSKIYLDLNLQVNDLCKDKMKLDVHKFPKQFLQYRISTNR